MYVEGVPTRKVKEVTEELCGTSYPKSLVSSLATSLDSELSAWRDRPLEAGGKVVYKHLKELSPEDMPARSAANRLRTKWLKKHRVGACPGAPVGVGMISRDVVRVQI